MAKFLFSINGERHQVEAEPEMPLLYLLRNHFGLNGPKFGCGLEQCGSCMVLLDGEKSPTCRLTVSEVGDREIVTLKGLTLDDDTLHPVQQAFLDEQAAQCGYCLNGMVIATVSLLKENSQPSEDEIKEALARNLCRCGTHSRVLKAVKRAAKTYE